MTNDEMISKMIANAFYLLPKEIGYIKALEWIKNYKFPEDSIELKKLYNLWWGIMYNSIMDMKKPSKEEIKLEEESLVLPSKLYLETFKKYFKKVGPSNVYRLLSEYIYVDSSEKLVKIKDCWKKITDLLDRTVVKKQELYKDLAEYYKNESLYEYYKYYILYKFYDLFD